MNIAFAADSELALIVLCHGKHNPTDAEWAPYTQLLSNAFDKTSSTRVLVITEGGHPSRCQQLQMNGTLGGSVARVAVISPSVVARFVTSILVMTNPGIRCFSPAERNEAYAHLGLAPSQAPRVDRLVAQVRQALDASMDARRQVTARFL